MVSLGVVLASPAPAQETETVPTGTLEDLQRQIDDLQARFDETPRLGSTRATMKLFGRIHLDAWTYPSADDGINVLESGDPTIDPRNHIEFRRARIGVAGAIEDSMHYKMELEFGKPESFSFKDVFFGFKDVPLLQKIKIGQQKRPYGLDALHSSRSTVFIERPFVVAAMNPNARRLGAVAYGIDDGKDWNWRYGVYNLSDWSKTGTYTSDRFQPEFAGRLAHTLHWAEKGRKYAHCALAASIAFPDGDPSPGDANNEARFRARPESRTESRWIDTSRIADTTHYELVGVEGVWNSGPLQWTGEYMNTWLSRGDSGEDLRFDGGYVQVAYFLTDDYMPWVPKTGTLGRIKPSNNLGPGKGAWQVAARYSFADFSDRDILGGSGESFTIGLNWYWNANAGIQLNYIRGEISDRMESVGGQTYTGGDYEMLGVRMRVDF